MKTNTDSWISKIHLQWFADAQDVDPEVEYEEDDEVEILFEDEVPQDTPEESDGSSDVSEDLKNQISSLQEKIENAKADSSEDRIAKGFDSLSESLKELAGKQKEPGQSSAEWDTEQKELQDILSDIDNKFYDSPNKALMAWARSNIAPAFQQMQEKINKLETELSETKGFTERSKLEKSESNKFVLEQFGDEVDKLAKDVGYQQAIKDVTFNHLDEIIANKVQTATSQEKPPAKNVSPSGAAGDVGSGKQKKRVVLTRDQKSRVEELKRRGLSEEQARSAVAGR
jgi:hypothetical protein